MVDLTDPIVLSSLVQTLVLTLTFVIFILSFRSQERATREAAYQRVLDDTTDVMKMPLTNPDLAQVQLAMARTGFMGLPRKEELTQQELAIRNYLYVLYGIFERAYLLYTRKWVDKDAWGQFDLWLQRMMDYPLFVEVHRSSTGMYDKPFQDYVDGLLDKDHRKSEPTTREK